MVGPAILQRPEAAMLGLPHHKSSVHQLWEDISSIQLITEALHPLFSCQPLGWDLCLEGLPLLLGLGMVLGTPPGATPLAM